jgi:mannobiose 2-epimerase
MIGKSPGPGEIAAVADRTERYLREVLLPFWMTRSPDPAYGGFLSYFDRHGRPTGETAKTFLMQARMLVAMSCAHRAGYGNGRCAELAQNAARFLAEHYWDTRNDGWFWIADRHGTPTFKGKLGYGQCFGVYAFSEYFLATGDALGREMAERSYSAICRHMVDTRHGGYLEIMREDWQPERPGKYGGDRKSLDVHMHLMEALTTFYEMTRQPTHRRRLQEVIDLILARMLHPGNGLGYVQFALDWQPLAPILFATEWGRDAGQDDGLRGQLDSTSPGHNVEFVWLLLHAADVLGQERQTYAETARPIFEHCVTLGLDHEYGGVYADVPMERPTGQTEKQFWQQAEALVGLLDACALLGDARYWQAFRNVYDFVFGKLVVMEAGGEWMERVDRQGNPIDPVLGHAWKICYHTVRSMVETVRRLRQLQANP